MQREESYFKEMEGESKMSDIFDRLYEDGRAEVIGEDIETGIRKGSGDRAIPLVKIAEFSGLSLDEVEKLKRASI